MKTDVGSPLTRLADLGGSDVAYFSCWESRASEIEALAGPILESPAFQRLKAITFLGILSPRFEEIVHSPLFGRRKRPLAYDGSRASHSLGVALTALDMARYLRFSRTAQRYAVAWGLLHDIGNWPLSHTGEFAFSKMLGISTKQLRNKLVLSDKALPRDFHLSGALRDVGLDLELTTAFLDHRDSNLPAELRDLHLVLTSALSPDSLEGMWRAGLVFNVVVRNPTDFVQAFLYGLFGVSLHQSYSEQAIGFWRRRRIIYQRFINRPSTIAWESAWSQAILRTFRGISLPDSLYLSESEVLDRVLALEHLPEAPVSRYKPPVEYLVEPRRKRALTDHASLQELARILIQRRMTPSKREGEHAAG